MRAATARRKRNILAARISLIAVVSLLACGLIWFGTNRALDKFFFKNTAYNLRELALDLDGVMTSDDLLAETGIRAGDNIFTIDLAATDRILRKIPMVADVCVERIMPDKIHVKIISREPVARISSKSEESPSNTESMILVDDSGFLMRPRLFQPAFDSLPVIHGVDIARIESGDPLIRDDLAKALALLGEARNRSDGFLKIRTLNIEKGYCIDAETDAGANIKFASTDFASQFLKLQRLLEHCRETGRELESVNLMVTKNTPVIFAMVEPPAPVNTAEKIPLNTKTSKPKKIDGQR